MIVNGIGWCLFFTVMFVVDEGKSVKYIWIALIYTVRLFIHHSVPAKIFHVLLGGVNVVLLVP